MILLRPSWIAINSKIRVAKEEEVCYNERVKPRYRDRSFPLVDLKPAQKSGFKSVKNLSFARDFA